MDYYSVLGVAKTATPDEIKKAYKKLAMKHHPDRTGGDDTQFKKIQEAYETLGDSTKKAAYDNPRHHSNNVFYDFNGFSDQSPEFNDFINQFFGQRSRSTSKQTFRTNVAITLVEAYHGSTKQLQVKTSTETKLITITIPAGVNTGDNVRYETVLENAVLLVSFVVLPDLRFERNGIDLYSNHSISVLDLIVGSKFQFRTIDDRVLEVKVSPKTQPFTQLRIPNAGMRTDKGETGYQIILLKPFIPDNIHDDVIECIKKHHIS